MLTFRKGYLSISEQMPIFAFEIKNEEWEMKY